MKTDSPSRGGGRLPHGRNWIRALLFLVCGTQASLQAESILFTGATVHTVSGPTLYPGQILVKGASITAVGSAIDQSADRYVDLNGLHVFPGIIAPTTSLGLTEISAVRSTLDTTEVGRLTPDVRSWLAVHADSELIPVARANGITHAVPVPQGGMVSGMSGLIALSGWTVEEMTVMKPVALHVFWPSMSLDIRQKNQFTKPEDFRSLKDQARERRKRIREIHDFFMEASAYVRGRKSANPPSLVPAWEAMIPWVQGEKPVMIHANDRRQIQSALDWAENQNFHSILAGARDAWQLADYIAERQIPVIYEHVFTQPARDFDGFDIHFSAPRKLQQAGVQVSFSLGLNAFGTSNLRNLPYAAAQAVAFGLPESEALKGLTWYPAQALEVGHLLGSIEVGKEATFFAANGNILDVRTQVKRLWIRGQEIRLEDRQTRLYEKYRARPRPQGK